MCEGEEKQGSGSFMETASGEESLRYKFAWSIRADHYYDIGCPTVIASPRKNLNRTYAAD